MKPLDVRLLRSSGVLEVIQTAPTGWERFVRLVRAAGRFLMQSRVWR